MMPVKKWLDLHEACAFVNMSEGIFKKATIKDRIVPSALGTKLFYKIEEIEEALERNVLFKF